MKRGSVAQMADVSRPEGLPGAVSVRLEGLERGLEIDSHESYERLRAGPDDDGEVLGTSRENPLSIGRQAEIARKQGARRVEDRDRLEIHGERAQPSEGGMRRERRARRHRDLARYGA